MPREFQLTPERTRQEILDWALEALLEQGQKSVLRFVPDEMDPDDIPESEQDSFMFCAYRGADNCRCAIGWLIPDEEYQGRFEKQTVASITQNVPALSRWVYSAWQEPLGQRREFLRNLQSAHDGIRKDQPFKKTLIDNLTMYWVPRDEFSLDNGFETLSLPRAVLAEHGLLDGDADPDYYYSPNGLPVPLHN